MTVWGRIRDPDRVRVGLYGAEAGGPRASLVSRASVCGEHQRMGGEEGNETSAYGSTTFHYSQTFVVGFADVSGCE